MTQTEALNRIAAYPFSRAEELTAEQMREIAREALAQPVQEPVAIRLSNGVIDVLGTAIVPIGALLYTTPPQRTWVGLDDIDLAGCGNQDEVSSARYWERVLMEKNK